VTLSFDPAATALDGFDASVLKPDGTIGVYDSVSSSPLRLRLRVAAGLTYQIAVVPIRAPEFELTTALVD
jgi:hypothetical protein